MYINGQLIYSNPSQFGVRQFAADWLLGSGEAHVLVMLCWFLVLSHSSLLSPCAGPNYPFSGEMAEVRIWKVALTENQIQVTSQGGGSERGRGRWPWWWWCQR